MQMFFAPSDEHSASLPLVPLADYLSRQDK